MITAQQQTKIVQHHKGSFFGDIAAPAIVRLSKQYISKEILDVGAGSGALLCEIAKQGYSCSWTAKGVDLYPQKTFIIQDDATKLDTIRGDSRDTLFCTDVLEHLTESELIDAKWAFHRVMKEGAYGIFTVPNNEDLSDNVMVCPFCEEKYHREGHQQSFTVKSLEKSFTHDNLFKVVKVKTVNMRFLATMGLPARLFYLFGLNRYFKHEQFTTNIFMVVQAI